MTNLIGDKSKIAIQYEGFVEWPVLTGQIVLWINNQYLGYYDESGSIYPVYKALKRLAYSEDFYEPEFIPLLDLKQESKAKDILLQMIPDFYNPMGFYDLTEEEQRELVKFDKYIVNFSECFDDFVIRNFKYNEEIFFIWKLGNHLNKHYFRYDDYGYEIKIGKVSAKELVIVLEEFHGKVQSEFGIVL